MAFFTLRKAENKDRDQLLHLTEEVLSGYGLRVSPNTTDEDLFDLESFYFKNKGWFAVLETNDKIVGSYGIFFVKPEICELRKMYLLKEYQGKGLGKLLMEDSLSKAIDSDYTSMTLEANKRLETALLLYRKYGFEEFKNTDLPDRGTITMKKQLI